MMKQFIYTFLPILLFPARAICTELTVEYEIESMIDYQDHEILENTSSTIQIENTLEAALTYQSSDSLFLLFNIDPIQEYHRDSEAINSNNS